MKNIFKSKLVLCILVAIILFSTICVTCFAAKARDNEPVATSDIKDDIEATYSLVASDVYEANDNVTIDTIIDGNAFAFGNNITVSGMIEGNLFVFGGTVTITDTAQIRGSIFAFAQNLVMNGTCYDVYSATKSLTIGKEAVITRDLRAGSDKIILGGQIKRDAYITMANLSFEENASNLIAGNLNYTADSEIADLDKIVTGAVKYTPPVSNENTPTAIYYVQDIISALLYSLVVVLLVMWIAPNFKEKSTKLLKKKPALSFGIGLLSLILAFVGAFFLLILSNGLMAGVSVAAIVLAILTLTISQTVFSMASARLINAKLNKDTNAMFIGMTLLVVLAINLVELIPGLGGFVWFVINMIGLGLIVLNLLYKKDLDSDKAEVVTETK